MTYCKVAFLLYFILAVTEKNNALCVHNISGEDIEGCLTNQTNICCKSLVYPIQKVNQDDNKNINIYLMSDISLDNAVDIVNYRNVTIIGMNTSKIMCSSNDNAGIFMHNSTNIVFSSITFEGCSMLQNSSTSMQSNPEMNEPILCTLFVTNCTNLALNSVTISQCKGTGMVLYNTRGHVTIRESNFESNVVEPDPKKYAGGGGLVIEFTGCELLEGCESQILGAIYTIEYSNFIGNSAHQHYPKRISHNLKSKKSYAGLGRGAGLFISIRGKASANIFVIRNCNILSNIAGTFGGGMYLSLGQGNSFNNSVNINDTNFINNSCLEYGGGGLFLSLFTYTAPVPANNTVKMNHVNFTNNTARLGGGLSILIQRGINASNVLYFYKSTWFKNSAEFGSAVDISPNWFDKAVDAVGNGRLPRIEFHSCTFSENNIITRKNQSNEVSKQGLATFLVTNFVISFKAYTEFSSNKGTGLYLIAGIVKIQPNSELTFSRNSAHYGGAMVLYGFSVLYMCSNSTLYFKQNEASTKGGAMFVESTDLHEHVYSRSCFLETFDREDNSLNDNVTITFSENKARTGGGNSIYASSLSPCKVSCNNVQQNEASIEDLGCLANISGLHENDVRTEANRFEIEHANLNLESIIPGKSFSIPVKAFDEFNHSSPVHYQASLKHNNSVKRDEKSPFGLYGMESKLTLYNSEDKIENNTLLLRRKLTVLEINITIIECPPGHVMNNDSECMCEVSKFQGMKKCDRENKTAIISSGYWLGLCSDGEQCTGSCPPGFCKTSNSIPLTERINDTHKLICSNNREGKLCGRCIANYSVYYHSDLYRCGDEKLCIYGILFYILSEILPLTAIFIVVVAFNINFTAGSLNGIIFFAQVYDTLIIYRSELFPKGASTLFQIARFLYALVNLNYFNTEKMSFCLWKGATTLDVISWKYVTIAYALLLIFVSVRVLNTTRCKRICIWWRPHTLKNAIIHGFTAFLVMSYSQCAKVSFQILTSATLLKYGLVVSERTIWYSSDNRIFSKAHTVYAVPAAVFMLIMVVLPPLSLLLFPAGFKILALCKLSELKPINFVSSRIPVQLFDSFQSCFKDHCRFVSGLYFLYRIIPLFLFAVTEFVFFYFLVEIFLILVLAFHCFLQPYKKSLHNRIDCFVFTSLAIINGLSFYIYMARIEGTRRVRGIKQIGQVAAGVQVILIYLPLFYIATYASMYAIKVLKKTVKRRPLEGNTVLLDSVYLPPLRDESDSQGYHKMKV